MNPPSYSTDSSSQVKASLTDLVGWFQSGEHRRAWFARIVFILIFALVFASAGCEVLTTERTDFPNALVDENGREIILDDLRKIAADANLTPDEKRQAMRDLGVDDEDLIDVLVAG